MTELPSSMDWVKHAPQSSKIERLEAYFSAHGFDPHRHDTYAIGRTLSGVQSFKYRGANRNSLPGETLVLHPDEEHDGHAGSSSGFRYRMLYITPALVQEILNGKPLPFLQGGISQDPRLAAATDAILSAMDHHLDPLEEDDSLFGLVSVLQTVCKCPVPKMLHDYGAARRAREFMDDCVEQSITLDDLAACANRDRWSLSKDFRAYFGTSPHRYLTMRRLDRVKTFILGGMNLTDAAVAAGFFDQSHMSKHFKKAYGISPSRWSRSLRGLSF
ncbi:AraC family transcriptional regulator [Pseudomonas wayambapalatensis]|uniref:AraC family transcriptional regulator n=1 Tax=Pseudomonas wayambapalatensis TaxID=485895 RepID=UPI003CEF4715